MVQVMGLAAGKDMEVLKRDMVVVEVEEEEEVVVVVEVVVEHPGLVMAMDQDMGLDMAQGMGLVEG